MLVMLGLGLNTFILVCVSLSPHFWRLCNIAISALRLCYRLANMQMVAGVLVSLTQKFSTAIVINGMEPAV